MIEEPSGGVAMLWLTLAGGTVLAGATVDLFFLGRFQRRLRPLSLPSLENLRQPPLTLAQVAPALAATLFFAITALLQPTPAPQPTPATLLTGPLLYTLAALAAAGAARLLTQHTPHPVFHAPACSATRAARLGLLYGLAVIPPIMLLSHLSAALCEALGYTPDLQDVFGWLSDETQPLGVRLFLMAAAVLLAPLAEETLFRGLLFRALLADRSFGSAALLTGLYFALIHFHAPSFIPLIALSMAFSAAYATTGSLLTPMIMHALFNATSLLLYLAGPV